MKTAPMRKTKNPRQALERLAEFLDISARPVSSTRWLLLLAFAGKDGPEARVEKTTNRALAFLADHAMRCHLDQDAVRAAVKWTGNPTSLSGVKGWELKALEWLTLAELAPRRPLRGRAR
jgi:hypothetical protein